MGMKSQITSELSPLERVIDIVAREIGSDRGAKAELARRLGVRPQYVNKMLKTNHVPGQQCRKLEAIASGEVTAEQLNPSIFGQVEGLV